MQLPSAFLHLALLWERVSGHLYSPLKGLCTGRVHKGINTTYVDNNTHRSTPQVFTWALHNLQGGLLCLLAALYAAQYLPLFAAVEISHSWGIDALAQTAQAVHIAWATPAQLSWHCMHDKQIVSMIWDNWYLEQTDPHSDLMIPTYTIIRDTLRYLRVSYT
jgi:hypothetical protein